MQIAPFGHSFEGGKQLLCDTQAVGSFPRHVELLVNFPHANIAHIRAVGFNTKRLRKTSEQAEPDIALALIRMDAHQPIRPTSQATDGANGGFWTHCRSSLRPATYRRWLRRVAELIW